MPNIKLSVVSSSRNSKSHKSIMNVVGKEPIHHVTGQSSQIHIFSYHTKKEAVSVDSKLKAIKGVKLTTGMNWDR